MLFLLSSILLSYLFYSYASYAYAKKDRERSLSQTLLSLKSTLVDSLRHADAVYLTDFDSLICGMDKDGWKELKVDSLREAPWFEEVRKKNGEPVMVKDAGGVFRHDYQKPFLSYIRLVRDSKTRQGTGFVILNLPVGALSPLLRSALEGDAQMILLDETNGELARSDSYRDDLQMDFMLAKLNKTRTYYSEARQGHLFVGAYIPEYNWKLIGRFPMGVTTEFSSSLVTFLALLLLGNGLWMLLCSLLISKSITKPIHRLIHAMQNVKNGDLSHVSVEHPKNEIGMLQENYNRMIEEIKLLLSRLVTEQKRKRKTELNALQEQIKPHFLYNTLDAIRCMALTDNPMAVYDAIETLGSFYRKSLEKGKNVVRIQEEISVTKDYIALLTLRYESLFRVNYELDPSLYPYKVPKLFLQPLVENAVYHGIKPMGEPGEITLALSARNGQILFEIRDNGIGMPEPIVRQVREGRWKNTKSIGLFGTLERLSLYYGNDFTVTVASHKNQGTTLRLAIPKTPKAEDEESLWKI